MQIGAELDYHRATGFWANVVMNFELNQLNAVISGGHRFVVARLSQLSHTAYWGGPDAYFKDLANIASEQKTRGEIPHNKS